MSKVVLDSSAVLAYLNDEAGGDVVEASLGSALLSTVNLAEVVARLVSNGSPRSLVRQVVDMLDLEIMDFDRSLAEEAGAMVQATKHRGLSPGDRACLALAAREKLSALTADRAWHGLPVGVDIRLIR